LAGFRQPNKLRTTIAFEGRKGDHRGDDPWAVDSTNIANGTIAVSSRDRRPTFQGASRRERDQEGPEGLEGVEHVLSLPPTQVVFTTVLQPTTRVREERGKSVATRSRRAPARGFGLEGNDRRTTPGRLRSEGPRTLARIPSRGSFRSAGTSQTNKKSHPPWLLPSAALPFISSDRGGTRLAQPARQPGWGRKRNRERPFRHPFSRVRTNRKLARA
jgi:hypothetical protein